MATSVSGEARVLSAFAAACSASLDAALALRLARTLADHHRCVLVYATLVGSPAARCVGPGALALLLLACASHPAPAAHTASQPSRTTIPPPQCEPAEPPPAAPAPPTCEIAGPYPSEKISIFTLDEPRRLIAIASSGVPMVWINPDIRKAEGQVRYEGNGVFKLSGWGKSEFNSGFHLFDRVMTPDGHGWVRSLFDVVTARVERVGDRVRFWPNESLLPRVQLETGCDNLRYGLWTGEYRRYIVYGRAVSEQLHAEPGLEIFDQPGGRRLHVLNVAKDLTAFESKSGFTFVSIADDHAVIQGWVASDKLVDPPPPPKFATSSYQASRRRPLRAAGPVHQVPTLAAEADLFVGAKPGGSPVGKVERGLAVVPGKHEAGFVAFEPASDAFSPPPDQQFWIREADLH